MFNQVQKVESNYDQTNLHTLRLTGRSMINLTEAQHKLHELVSSCSEEQVKQGTPIYTNHIREGFPSLFFFSFNGGSQHKLKSDLNLIVIDLENLIYKLGQCFYELYGYQNFTPDDFHLMMMTSGFSGYYVKLETCDAMVLFNPKDHLC